MNINPFDYAYKECETLPKSLDNIVSTCENKALQLRLQGDITEDQYVLLINVADEISNLNVIQYTENTQRVNIPLNEQIDRATKYMKTFYEMVGEFEEQNVLPNFNELAGNLSYAGNPDFTFIQKVNAASILNCRLKHPETEIGDDGVVLGEETKLAKAVQNSLRARGKEEDIKLLDEILSSTNYDPNTDSIQPRNPIQSVNIILKPDNFTQLSVSDSVNRTKNNPSTIYDQRRAEIHEELKSLYYDNNRLNNSKFKELGGANGIARLVTTQLIKEGYTKAQDHNEKFIANRIDLKSIPENIFMPKGVLEPAKVIQAGSMKINLLNRFSSGVKGILKKLMENDIPIPIIEEQLSFNDIYAITFKSQLMANIEKTKVLFQDYNRHDKVEILNDLILKITQSNDRTEIIKLNRVFYKISDEHNGLVCTEKVLPPIDEFILTKEQQKKTSEAKHTRNKKLIFLNFTKHLEQNTNDLKAQKTMRLFQRIILNNPSINNIQIAELESIVNCIVSNLMKKCDVVIDDRINISYKQFKKANPTLITNFNN